jgi:hypothetical protein
MNFTTAGDPVDTAVDTATYNLRDTVTVVAPTGGSSVAVITGVLSGGGTLEVPLTDGITGAAIITEIVNAINSNPLSNFTAAPDTGDGTILTLTAIDDTITAAVNFTVEDRDAGGTLVGTAFTAAQLSEDGTTGVTNTPDGATVPLFVAQAGTDFLDFSDYLTSQFDSSPGAAGDSADSNILIPVDLDYNETSSATNAAEANEVVVVRMVEDTAEGETFSALSASVVAQLFNNTLADADNEFAGLTEGNLSVATYQKTDTEALIGDAKAIFMVENDQNLGEYKVFELTWAGDNASGAVNTVSAVEIGGLDFGTSLTGLNEINLVGSDEYADLIQNGFMA